MVKDLISNAVNMIKAELLNMPKSPGVYRMLDKNNKVLYVGKAKDLAKRIVNYTQLDRLSERIKLAISQTIKLEIITVNTEAQALILEANLIKSLKPKYNILLKDDKSMPYILLRQDHIFPQLLKFRGKKNIDGLYFGPFASSSIVDSTIEFLEKTFLLRNCSDSFFTNRKSACMQYQIKRCSAPCVNKITPVEYNQNVKQALDFLQGKSLSLQQELGDNMQQASDNMQYEKAAKHRDQLKALNYIQNKNSNLFNLEDADVIAITKTDDTACIQLFLFRNGQNYGNRCFFFEQVSNEEPEKILTVFLAQLYQNNTPPKETILNIIPEDLEEINQAFNINIQVPKKGAKFEALKFAQDNAEMALARKYKEKSQNQKLLQQVRELFETPNEIKKIEVYDNSHIMGAHAIGAMIVATEDGFSKKHYRKYNIKTTDIGDDYAMLAEVLSRRLSKLEDNVPDLLLIDGGQEHLKIAKKVLDQFGLSIPLVCIAKGIDRNSGREVFHQFNKAAFTLDKSIPVMKYLQILRDEAHRFAITTHRKKREKAMDFSILKQIPGIGNVRRKILTNHFASIEEIKNATIAQLTKLTGINKKTAEDIFAYFHP
jgi:excinuclease ABC subunit C